MPVTFGPGWGKARLARDGRMELEVAGPSVVVGAAGLMIYDPALPTERIILGFDGSAEVDRLIIVLGELRRALRDDGET